VKRIGRKRESTKDLKRREGGDLSGDMEWVEFRIESFGRRKSEREIHPERKWA